LPCTMTALPPDNCGMRIVELSWVKMQIRIPYSLKFLCRCHCGRQFHARRRLKTAQQKLRLQQTPQEWGNDEATEKTHDQDQPHAETHVADVQRDRDQDPAAGD